MSWYGTYHSRNNIEQGVILFRFPLPDLETINIPSNDQEQEVEFNPYDVIVLTQTCDLASKDIDRVYLCPVYTMTDYFKKHPEHTTNNDKIRSEYERLQQGRFVNKFLLNECTLSIAKNFKGEFLVVFFDKAVVVSRKYIDEYLKNSSRKKFIAVKPPYREAMAQHYARYFMRIGTPIDYPRKEDINATRFKP